MNDCVMNGGILIGCEVLRTGDGGVLLILLPLVLVLVFDLIVQSCELRVHSEDHRNALFPDKESACDCSSICTTNNRAVGVDSGGGCQDSITKTQSAT